MLRLTRGRSANDFFGVDGFFEVTVDKEAGALLPGPPPDFLALVDDFDPGGMFRFEPIPEPSTMALILVCGLMLLHVRRRS